MKQTDKGHLVMALMILTICAGAWLGWALWTVFANGYMLWALLISAVAIILGLAYAHDEVYS